MYLLDTNVLSHAVRRGPSASLGERLRRHASDPLFTSCICVMEFRHGAMRRTDHGSLWARIQEEILSRVEVLGVGLDEAVVAGDTISSEQPRWRET